MKTFSRTYLPETIKYNGIDYQPNGQLSATFGSIHFSLSKLLEALKKGGQKAVLVKVLSKNLKGKTDLYGKPYQPTLWIFTN